MPHSGERNRKSGEPHEPHNTYVCILSFTLFNSEPHSVCAQVRDRRDPVLRRASGGLLEEVPCRFHGGGRAAGSQPTLISDVPAASRGPERARASQASQASEASEASRSVSQQTTTQVPSIRRKIARRLPRPRWAARTAPSDFQSISSIYLMAPIPIYLFFLAVLHTRVVNGV